MGETIHIVKEGEYMAKIAKRYGFPDWKTIYDYPKNKDFKKERPNPDILVAGDKVVIPPKDSKQVDIQTDKKFKVKIKTKELETKLHLIVKGYDNKPLANTPFELAIGEETITGTSKSDGLVEALISPEAEFGTLRLTVTAGDTAYELTLPIGIGHLDPVEEVSGIRARLINLGYEPGGSYDMNDPRFHAAIEEFQCDHSLTIDGVCGPKTKAKLKEVHGC